MGPGQITGAMVRGLSPKDMAATRIVAGNITKGDLSGFGQGDYGGNVVVVGARLAEQLGVKPGDNISLISPAGGATAFGGTPVQKSYVVGATRPTSSCLWSRRSCSSAARARSTPSRSGSPIPTRPAS
jgi:lipoprotein-releasing system permease protein